MTYEEARIILECDATNVIGELATSKKRLELTLEAIDTAIEALEYVKEMQEFALNTTDEFYGEVLCRKLAKHGFLKSNNGYYEVAE